MDSEANLPVLAYNLQRAGLPTNHFSSGPKHLLVVVTFGNPQITFLPPYGFMGGSHMPVHRGSGDLRVVGRHLFPPVYHKVDKLKQFSTSELRRLWPWFVSTAITSIKCRTPLPGGNNVGWQEFGLPHTIP